MRVAFLTHEPFHPPSGGGSAEAVYLVEEFVARGHEVHLFCPKLEDGEGVRRRFGVRLHEFTTWEMGRYTSLRSAKYLIYPSFLKRMVEQAHRTEKFELIFSQHAISAVAAGRLKDSLGLPVVMNFLDYLTGFMETWPAYLAPPPLLKLLKRFELSLPSRHRVDALLTVSDTLGELFAESGYPRERILPINYGFDPALFPLRTELPAREAAPVMVMHGSLDHHHLRDIGLAALARVVSTRPDVVFRIVGRRTPALDAFLNKAEKIVPGARIECTGFVPYGEVAGLLAGATVGIVPYEESIGTHCAFVAKIVEYLAVGLPVVSTPLRSARSYFRDESRVRFSGFDGAGFGDAVLSWLGEPAEADREAARRASERVRRELAWGAISRKAVAFVEKTLHDGRVRQTAAR